jgi:hypothetical protein
MIIESFHVGFVDQIIALLTCKLTRLLPAMVLVPGFLINQENLRTQNSVIMVSTRYKDN